MKIRNALLTAVAGLTLSAGVATEASAQSVYRYRNYNQDPYYQSGNGYRTNDMREARRIVRQAYRDILGRNPDASGLSQYTDAMVRRGWTDAEVRQSLMQSDEYAQRSYNRGYGYRSYRNWRYR
jgi:hypothetical protein